MGNGENEKKWHWLGYAIMVPAILSFFLAMFGVPYVGYFIPVVIMLGFLLVGLTAAFRGTGVVSRLLGVVFGLMMAYGAIAFIFPDTLAEHLTPADWRWPAGRTAEALALPDGEWAVALRSTPRVQIYDSEGNYLRGWYVPAGGGVFSIALPPAGLGEGIVVGIVRKRAIHLYSLRGELLSETPSDKRPGPIRNGRYENRSFPIEWYEWPFVTPLYGWACGAAGMVGLLLVQYLEGRKKSGSGPQEKKVRGSMQRDPDQRRKLVAILCCAAYLFLFFQLSSREIFAPGGILGVLFFLGPPIFIYYKLVVAKQLPHFDKGISLLRHGETDRAVHELEQAVRNDDHIGAALRLADMYLKGEGVAPDRDKAIEYYRKAKTYFDFFNFRSHTAENSSGVAGKIGRKMLGGQTREMVSGWIRIMQKTLEPLAEEGGAWAAELLADLHGNPRNPDADPELAVKYARMVHENENTAASLVKLGRMLIAYGDGVQEGIACLERAFSEGNLEAGCILATAYVKGSENGIQQDWDRALEWAGRVLAVTPTKENDPDESVPIFSGWLGAVLLDENKADALSAEQKQTLYSRMRRFRYLRKDVAARWKVLLKA